MCIICIFWNISVDLFCVYYFIFLFEWIFNISWSILYIVCFIFENEYKIILNIFLKNYVKFKKKGVTVMVGD